MANDAFDVTSMEEFIIDEDQMIDDVILEYPTIVINHIAEVVGDANPIYPMWHTNIL